MLDYKKLRKQFSKLLKSHDRDSLVGLFDADEATINLSQKLIDAYKRYHDAVRKKTSNAKRQSIYFEIQGIKSIMKDIK